MIKWHLMYTLLTCRVYMGDWWLFSLFLCNINKMNYFQSENQMSFIHDATMLKILNVNELFSCLSGFHWVTTKLFQSVLYPSKRCMHIHSRICILKSRHESNVFLQISRIHRLLHSNSLPSHHSIYGML